MAHEDDYRPLSDKEIINLVDENVRTSTGYYDSELSRERKKVIDYYNGILPRPTHEGNSRYVSQDVYDCVESMKAALLETFSAGNQIAKFAPQNASDVVLAEVCSRYTDYVLFRQNDLFSVMRNAIHDGLTARVGIAKVYWQTAEETSYQEFENLSQNELDMMLAEDNVELVYSEEDEVGLFSGEIEVTTDASQVKIENIAPEEFLIEPQAKSLHCEDINFCGHRTRKTLSELRAMGFDEDVIANIGDHDDVDFETDPEVLARHDGISPTRGLNNTGYQDQVRSVMVYEIYMQLDVDGSGVTQLFRIMKAGNALLDIEQVNRKPFVVFTPLPIPHAFYGSNFAEKLVATQNARTVLTRSILDHAAVTNAPRYIVTKGGLSNPRELIDNRHGGIVNTTRPDAIQPMPQASLNPFVFQTLKLLDEDKEDNTGVSRLSQGLNKDAISKQNSAAMVEQLATMSMGRQKIIARNFAEGFLKPVYYEAYRLCVENEQEEKIVEIAGQYVPVNPSAWSEKRDVLIELKLGYGEQDRELQKLLQLHQLFSQDPNLQPMYQMPNRFALMRDALKRQGILNVEEYLTPPDQLPQPQPDPMAQMQQQLAAKQIELQERQTAVAELKVQIDAQQAQMKQNLEEMKAEADHALKSDQLDLKEEQFAHKQRVDQAELDLARQADDITAIASPN